MTSNPTLTYEVYVAPIIAMAGNDIPPGQSRSTWSPISATLISGQHDAVLADPLMTVEQGMAVADWVSTTGKNLTTVYVTHGHGDHWFGLGAVRERFPGVRAVATPGVVERMRKWSAPDVMQEFWQARFPGQISDRNPVADPLDGPSFELEGRPLVAVNAGHTDTDDTTVLHVPDIGLVVAGDAAYNDVHQYLAESDSHGRKDWLAALDIVEALDPRAVVAGHKRYGKDDSPRIIDETRQYIRDFDRLDKETATAEELYWQMLAMHPHRINPGALWLSAQSAKASSGPGA
jgi:glyoxylase-like metal-dependent hydrolase (beta-lactamase superfamily II)